MITRGWLVTEDVRRTAREVVGHEVFAFAGLGTPHILAYHDVGASPQPLTSSGFNELMPVFGTLDYALHKLNTIADARMRVIVDEPEAHLHPDAQIRLAHKLAEIVNKYKPRLYLLLSSHSDIFVHALIKRAGDIKILDLCRLYGFEHSEGARGVVVRRLDVDESGWFEPVKWFVTALEQLFS